MRRSVSALFIFLALAAPAGAATPQGYVGLQGVLLTGTHTDVAGEQRGAALGAILQLGARIKRFGVRLEGIPPVSLPQKPTAFYGQATPQLSLINGTLRYAVDRHENLWLGIGETIINQRTPLPNISQVVTSRLAGVRYEAEYRHAYSPTHFWDIIGGGAPRLWGSDYYKYSINHPPVNKEEAAAELDVSVAWGVMHGDTEWLFGLRTIDFSAKYIATGLAGDRNNGGGAIVEWRHLFR